MDINEQKLNFQNLVGTIHQIHHELADQASRSVNVSLTLRNWLIGCYISEYELCGGHCPPQLHPAGELLLRKLSYSHI